MRKLKKEADMMDRSGQIAKSTTPFFNTRLEVARQAHFVPPQSFMVGAYANKQGESLETLYLMAYAIAANMNREQALELFGEHYEAVLLDPLGTNHPNIRALLAVGTDNSPVADLVNLYDYGVSISLIEGCWAEMSTINLGLENEVMRVLQYIEEDVIIIPEEGKDHWINKALKIAESLKLLTTI